MLKRLADNYEVICYRFGHAELCKHSATLEIAQDVANKDIHRTAFLGSEIDFDYFKKQWGNLTNNAYSQGNMECVFPHILFVGKLYAESAIPESLKFLSLRFAYRDSKKHLCGLSLQIDANRPKAWMLGILRQGNAAPQNRQVYLYLGPDHELVHFEKRLSWKAMLANLIEEIGSSTIAPIIRALFKADGTINLSLLELLDNHLHTNRYLNPVELIGLYHDPQNTLTALNTQGINGCNAYLDNWVSKLPHNKAVQQKILDLSAHLKGDINNTAYYISEYLLQTREITLSLSATSCLLSAIVNDDLLRSALDLLEFCVDELNDSKTVREFCLIKTTETIKKLRPEPENDSDSDNQPLAYSY